MSSFIRDLHVQAMAVVSGLDDAITFAPRGVVGGGRHVESLRRIRVDAQRMLELTGEEGGLEQEFAGTDYQALLYELLDAVQLQGGRQGLATTDRAGLDSAIAAVREMGPLLGKPPDDRGDLLEAVRAQDATCTLHLFAANRERFDRSPNEAHADYPVPPGVALAKGLVLLVPVAPPATGRRRANVVEVIADGRCTIVRAKLCRPDIVVVAAPEPTTPEPFLKGDELGEF